MSREPPIRHHRAVCVACASAAFIAGARASVRDVMASAPAAASAAGPSRQGAGDATGCYRLTVGPWTPNTVVVPAVPYRIVLDAHVEARVGPDSLPRRRLHPAVDRVSLQRLLGPIVIAGARPPVSGPRIAFWVQNRDSIRAIWPGGGDSLHIEATSDSQSFRGIIRRSSFLRRAYEAPVTGVRIPCGRAERANAGESVTLQAAAGPAPEVGRPLHDARGCYGLTIGRWTPSTTEVPAAPLVFELDSVPTPGGTYRRLFPSVDSVSMRHPQFRPRYAYWAQTGDALRLVWPGQGDSLYILARITGGMLQGIIRREAFPQAGEGVPTRARTYEARVTAVRIWCEHAARERWWRGLRPCGGLPALTRDGGPEIAVGRSTSLRLPRGFTRDSTHPKEFVHGGERWSLGAIKVEVAWGMWGPETLTGPDPPCRAAINHVQIAMASGSDARGAYAVAWYLIPESPHEPLVTVRSADPRDRALLPRIPLGVRIPADRARGSRPPN